MAYPSIYRAKAIQFDGTTLSAYVPQVFGDVTIEITEFIGDVGAGMGWVLFQAGNPEFPVWLGSTTTPSTGPATPAVNEVWVGPDEPTDPAIEIWYDTDEVP